jgi:UDP-N-acetylmuramyl pentapeptide phosphotransferase/UDP-N-acetylglucosamine-1-phosphate transferase
MNFAEVIQNLNWLAIIVAALSTFMIGGLWYSVFEKPWMAANNFTNEDLKKRKMPVVFGLSFFFAFLMSLNLSMFIGKEDLAYGTIAGFLTGFGWVALGIAIITLFENRPLKYVLINGGYMTVSFTLMGAILGAWK